MSSKDALKRRDLLNVAVGTGAAAFAAAAIVPVARFVAPRGQAAEGPVTVGVVADFPAGSARTVLVHDRPVLVVRSADGELRAFSALCTHLQCVVAYAPERNRIECPCHRGVYGIDGRNLEGPPTRPLDELVVAVDDGRVVVSET